uniref:SAS-6 centriolar assembly protein n=1 Tax=Mus musculus TaxID=10090 RepID=A0A140T8I7_MOUSE
MSQVLFQQLVPLLVKCKDCEERRGSVRVSIELQSLSNPVHRKLSQSTCKHLVVGSNFRFCLVVGFQ